MIAIGIGRISRILLGHNFVETGCGRESRKCNQTRLNSNFNSNWDFIDLSAAEYEKVCSETLDGLFEYFEELMESTVVELSDIIYNDGVLTVNLGSNGIYVINRQTPNKQIWLSSPKSGPKRYDFFGSQNAKVGKWKYKHTGESLHDLLQNEVKTILGKDVNFFKLPYSGN